MNKLLKLTPIILALVLLVGCGESSPMAVEPDPTSSVVNGSATVVSSGTVLVSSSSTDSIVTVSSSSGIATTSSSSVGGQSVSSSTPAGYLPGYIPRDANSKIGDGLEDIKTYLNKPFSLAECSHIDTTLPHGINPTYLNFITMMQESGTAPANYDSLLTTMSVLRCVVNPYLYFEVTHPGNSNTGLIPTWYAINFNVADEFGAMSFGTDVLNTDMEKVVMQHAGLNRADVGKNGVVFLASAFVINQFK